MNIRKRRFILLFILILALMSVYFASKLVTDASYIGDTSSLPLRWGDVKYGTKPREIIASHAGETPESMSLILTWDDVLDNDNLLCCEEFGPIPGRTTAAGAGGLARYGVGADTHPRLLSTAGGAGEPFPTGTRLPAHQRAQRAAVRAGRGLRSATAPVAMGYGGTAHCLHHAILQHDDADGDQSGSVALCEVAWRLHDS